MDRPYGKLFAAAGICAEGKRLRMMDNKKLTDKSFWQFVKFALVGVSNTLVSEGVYAVLVFFKMHYLPASFIGFSLSVLNAYYWSNRYVFTREEGEERVWWKVLCKTYVAYLGGYLLSAFLLFFWIDVLKIARWMELPATWCAGMGLDGFDAEFLGSVLAAGLNLLLTVPINFLVNKYWAYRQKTGGTT